jgi:hypothetical protein
VLVSARALVLLALLAALLVSCGGEDDGSSGEGPGGPTRTTAAATSPKARFSEQFRTALKTISNRAPEDAALRTMPLLIFDAASDLERIEPPRDVRRAHRRFIAGLRQTARDIQPVIDAYVRNDRGASRRLLNLSWISPRSLRLVRSSRREFAAKGYDLGDVTKLPRP